MTQPIPFVYESINYRGKFFTVSVDLSEHPDFNLVSFVTTDSTPDLDTLKESLRATKVGFKVNLGYGYIENAIKHYIHNHFGSMDAIETRTINEHAKALRDNLKEKVDAHGIEVL